MAKRIGHYINRHSWRQSIPNGLKAPTPPYDDTSCVSGYNGRSERAISGANNALRVTNHAPPPQITRKVYEGRPASRRRNQVWVGKLRTSRFKIPVASKHAYHFRERYRRNCRLVPSLPLQPPTQSLVPSFHQLAHLPHNLLS